MRSTDSLLHAAEPGLPPPPPAQRRAHGGRPRGPAEVASQLARFVAVGAASTAAYLLLYLLFRGVMAAQAFRGAPAAPVQPAQIQPNGSAR